MSDERNSPCPSEDGFPGDMHIALACERCPQLIIVCQKYGHAGLASGDLTDEVARVTELEAALAERGRELMLAAHDLWAQTLTETHPDEWVADYLTTLTPRAEESSP